MARHLNNSVNDKNEAVDEDISDVIKGVTLLASAEQPEHARLRGQPGVPSC